MITIVASIVVKLRFLIVVAWAIALAAALYYLPGLSQLPSSPLNFLTLTNSKAVSVERESVDRFSFPVLTRTMVVQRNAQGLSTAAQERVISRALDVSQHHPKNLTDLVFAFPVINTLGIVPGSRESSTTAITYLFFRGGTPMPVQDQVAHRYAAMIDQPGDSLVGVTGGVPANWEMGNLVDRSMPLVTAATVALIVVILAIAFRGVGAPLITLLSAALAYLIGAHIIGWFGQLEGGSIPVELQPLLLVLVFAVLTDYSVLYMTAFRRRLRAGESPLDAIALASSGVTPIVFAAGLTVVAAGGALSLAKLGFIHAVGPGLAIALGIVLLVAITLIPSLLAIFGRWLFWPGLRLHAGVPASATIGQAQSTVLASERGGVIRLLTFRPVALAAIALLGGALAFAWWQTAGIRLGLDVLQAMPSNTETGRAAAAASRGFAAGITAPTLILVHQSGIADQRLDLIRLEDSLQQQPGVAGIIGPREAPVLQPQGAIFAKSGNDVRFLLVLDQSPYTAPAIAAVDNLSHKLPSLLGAAGLSGASAGVAGDTAISAETIHIAVSDIIRVAIALVLAEMIILAVFLRSLVAPIYLVAASVLALGAPLAITMAIFDQGLGLVDLAFLIPITAGVLLVALGSDYNIFMVGRVAQAAADSRPLWQAVMIAAPRVRRAIVVAALTLAFSFATLAIVPLNTARELAAALFIGILIDSFVVRSYLVPAMIGVFGHLGRRAIED